MSGRVGSAGNWQLELRPSCVCNEDNTQTHASSGMLALKVRRRLEEAWQPLGVTVGEGLRLLEQLWAIELVHQESGNDVARYVPELGTVQRGLLEALQLVLPSTVP